MQKPAEFEDPLLRTRLKLEKSCSSDLASPFDGITLAGGCKPTVSKEKLCERCERLQLHVLVNRPHEVITNLLVRKYRIAVISQESIIATCYLCTQLRNFFRASPSLWLWAYRDDGVKLHFYVDLPNNDLKTYLFPAEARNVCLAEHDPTLIWENETSSPIHSSTRRISPNLPDFQTMRLWISQCKADHQENCQTNGYGTVPKVLIDCQRRTLCTRESQPRSNAKMPYVCLSYVWGPEEATHVVGGGTLPVNLPRTITDAIDVTLKIGFKYLWVDRYCIDQNDANAKHDAIRNMDMIYQGAELTIIAASSDKPSDGLPGISGAREQRATLVVGNHVFMSVRNARKEIELSRWNTRGWTYQEAMLSVRRLVFTNSQVYFQCCSGFRMECWTDDKGPAVSDKCKDFEAFKSVSINGRQRQETIYDRLAEYYERELRFDTDILHAFSGMFRVYSRHKEGPYTIHFYGVPIIVSNSQAQIVSGASSTACDSFALGLAWKVYVRFSGGKSIYRLDTCDSPFPSWSWASFKAARPKSDQGSICFYPCDLDDEIPRTQKKLSPHVYHNSGKRLSLDEYVSQPYDYNQFLPFIEITSIVTPGRLTRKYDDRPRFSTISGLVHLHERYDSIVGEVLALFVTLWGGGFVWRENVGKFYDGSAIYLLVTKNFDTKYHRFGPECGYRLVGILEAWFESPAVGNSPFPQTDEEILSAITHGQPGSWQTLRLV
ncbi:heterokaryon incompatibility protein-domain-containing protein [Paraphoma chrysanthemicola]|nr:heterokaryon incompatibility protein-domain-containing protein [Paraphoma chrysanthemicola]